MRDVTVPAKASRCGSPNGVALHVADGAAVLYSYGVPVVYRTAEGHILLDSRNWKKSKATTMHIREFLGQGRPEVTDKILAGEYELVNLQTFQTQRESYGAMI